MCVEFPAADLQLKNWARWIRVSEMPNQLGYSNCASHLKLPGGSFNKDQDNPDAERVDKLVSELSKKYNDIYRVLKSHYVYLDNNRDGAKYQKIHIGKYQTYLKIGIAWVDRGLFDLQVS